jgi:hypothetical protein
MTMYEKSHPIIIRSSLTPTNTRHPPRKYSTGKEDGKTSHLIRYEQLQSDLQ